MSKRVGKVRVNLDSKNLIEISMKDIKAIIRGADDCAPRKRGKQLVRVA